MEKKLLENWKLKIGILTGILVPAITATGAIYGIKEDAHQAEASLNRRISEVELKTEINKADKSLLEQVQRDVSRMREDVVEIKTLLRARR